MAVPIQSHAKCEVRSVVRTKRMGSVLKFLTRYAQADEFLDSIVTEDETWGFHYTPEISTKMMRCKNKSWRGSKGWWQTSMSRGYGSWFQNLINVWTIPATMLKNKVIHSQCRFCKLKILYMFKTFTSLLSGHTTYIQSSLPKFRTCLAKSNKVRVLSSSTTFM
jgi:hypothetical protein